MCPRKSFSYRKHQNNIRSSLTFWRFSQVLLPLYAWIQRKIGVSNITEARSYNYCSLDRYTRWSTLGHVNIPGTNLLSSVISISSLSGTESDSLRVAVALSVTFWVSRFRRYQHVSRLLKSTPHLSTSSDISESWEMCWRDKHSKVSLKSHRVSKYPDTPCTFQVWGIWYFPLHYHWPGVEFAHYNTLVCSLFLAGRFLIWVTMSSWWHDQKIVKDSLKWVAFLLNNLYEKSRTVW